MIFCKKAIPFKSRVWNSFVMLCDLQKKTFIVVADASLWLEQKFSGKTCEDLSGNDFKNLETIYGIDNCDYLTREHLRLESRKKP
jgi:hypothetical protein